MGKYIPGFRSGKTWKKVVAVAGYLAMFAMLFGYTGTKILALLILLTVVIATTPALRSRIPLLNSPSRWKAAGGWAVVGVVMVVVSTIGLPPSTPRTPAVAGADDLVVAVAADEKPTSAPRATNTPRATAGPRPSATPQPTTVPTAAPDPAQIANQQWEEFLRYGPEVVSYLKRSDILNTAHTVMVPPVLTGANRGAFYTATNDAAERTGVLKRQSTQVQVPRQANDFKNAVTLALSQREDSFNKLKEAINAPNAANESAYQTAKRLADNSAIRPVLEMIKLCETMNATIEECNTAVGL